MFQDLNPGDVAVIVSKGVYRQCALSEMDGGLYAKMGRGYIRINADGRTSSPAYTVVQLATDLPLFKDQFGRLAVKEGKGRKALESSPLLAIEKGG